MNRVETRLGRVELAVQRHRLAARERMRVAGVGMDPAQAVALEREAREHGRGGPGGIDRGERVVPEAGERQLVGPDGAAGRSAASSTVT